MLTDYYSSYAVYKNTGTGSFDVNTWVYSSTEKGFIQPTGGGETFRDMKSGEDSTHKLYTGVAVNIEYGDKVTQNGVTYKVISAFQPAGISGILRHKEISLRVFE